MVYIFNKGTLNHNGNVLSGLDLGISSIGFELQIFPLKGPVCIIYESFILNRLLGGEVNLFMMICTRMILFRV